MELHERSVEQTFCSEGALEKVVERIDVFGVWDFATNDEMQCWNEGL